MYNWKEFHPIIQSSWCVVVRLSLHTSGMQRHTHRPRANLIVAFQASITRCILFQINLNVRTDKIMQTI